MGSSRPSDRSLGEATFLPQWMKGKLDTRFDYTDSTFSPPADDSFFYIRYPRKTESASAAATAAKDSLRPEPLAPEAGRDARKILDFSKHPPACQAFVPLADKANGPKIIIANKLKVKHQTNNDEFRNDDAAECGRSIVSVASQIMSSKFGKSNSSDSASTASQGNESVNQQQQHKKASRSLPATPLASPSGTPDSSPKSRRRVYGNRFFTGAFVPDGERPAKNGWLLGSILGQSRELIAPKIEEEDEQAAAEPIPARALSRKKSISSQNLTYLGANDEKSPRQYSILQAKPSELREMNFWSPTSM